MSNFIEMNSTNITIDEVPFILMKLGEIAAKIGYYNFEWRFVTLVIFNIQTPYVVNAFLNKYNQSVILKQSKYLSSRRVQFHTSQFILFGQQASEISDTLKLLMESMSDRSGKFIIICVSTEDELCDEKQVFLTLSRLYIPNIVFLKGDAENSVRIYSYWFMRPEQCPGHEPYEIEFERSCKDGLCYKSIFREQLANFQRCPLTVSTFEQPPFMLLNNSTGSPSGIDGEMLTLLTDILNASLVIVTPTEGAEWGAYENFNWTGSLGDVYNNRSAASMCSIPLTSDIYGNFQISFTYNTMDIVWSAKLPLLKPAWEKLLRPLKFYPRLILIFMFMVIIFMNSFTKTRRWNNIRKVFNASPPTINLFFYSWTIFLGMPVLRMPSKRNFIALVYLWIWFSFIIRSCYLAALKDSLKHSAYENKLTSINDVLSKKFPIGGPESLKAFYSEDSQIFDDWMPINFSNTFDILDEITKGESNFVLAFNKEVILEYLKQFNGTRKLQIIPQKIVNSPSVIYFAKHSPLAKPISRVLKICVEAGFLEQVYNRRTDYLRSQSFDKVSHQYEPMNLKYFAGTIGLLILGWFLSIIFFIVEVYCGRLDGK
ncbi:uncharacterized protein [Battus philenor]|uniref:uncharacterized protein n=1 Tax=Battus philenor TaxID=42288 RepID=UPI0035D0ACEB